jgi:uncharacterized tellurite resistance protein B-like protein
MLQGLKSLLREGADRPDEQLQIETAVAALLFEMTRMEGERSAESLDSARAGPTGLFAGGEARADELLRQASAPGNRLTSYFDVVSLINRQFTLERKIALVEHLWRIAYADADLDLQEDHVARKLSELLYVPHVQCMLARQRARDG